MGLHHWGVDGGSTHLWNVGLLKRDCMALHPRKLQSSCWYFFFSHVCI